MFHEVSFPSLSANSPGQAAAALLRHCVLSFGVRCSSVQAPSHQVAAVLTSWRRLVLPLLRANPAQSGRRRGGRQAAHAGTRRAAGLAG